MKVKLINEQITSDYGKSLLRARGIEDVETFLNPDESCLQDWRDLDNMEKGVELIQRLNPSSRIGLVVDCDVDGFTSASIFYNYFMKLHPDFPKENIVAYIHTGKAHGLEEHWEEIRDENFDLVVVPDAGSNDSRYAAELKCNVLVIDHHLVESNVFSDKMVIINNQLSEKYRNKNLSGAGMVYQFCRAMDFYLEKDFAKNFIDLAALGICADMMSGLEIENQYFWKEGFSHVTNAFFMTLALKQSYSITGKVTTTWGEIQECLNPMSVAFYIVPLINAMIRVGTQEEKERLWLAFIDGHQLVKSNKRGAKGVLEEVCIESARECTNARTKQNKVLDKVVEGLEIKIAKYDLLENKVLVVVLDEEEFPSELNGLCAMKLAAKYKRPTIVARLNDEGYVRGSSRGLNQSELKSFKNFMDQSGLFEYTAGHDNACGISIPFKSLKDFEQYGNRQLIEIDFGEEYYEVNFVRQALSDDLAELIADLSNYKSVWSQQNGEALVYVKDLHFSQKDIQIMGKNKDTIKIVKNGVAYMKFFAKEMIEELRQYDELKMEVVGKANLNFFAGVYTPQIFIVNYEIKEDKLIDF